MSNGSAGFRGAVLHPTMLVDQDAGGSVYSKT